MPSTPYETVAKVLVAFFKVGSMWIWQAILASVAIHAALLSILLNMPLGFRSIRQSDFVEVRIVIDAGPDAAPGMMLSLTIDNHGILQDVEVVEGSGFGFDEEALRAVRASKFRPAVRNGKPVASRALLPVRFLLRGSGDD
jgi:TonB family protein